MKFTGVIYGNPDKWVIIIDGEVFRFQEIYYDNDFEWEKGQMYKIFGKQKFKKIVKILREYEGKIREFELSDERLTSRNLWRHVESGQLHESQYNTVLWEAKH